MRVAGRYHLELRWDTVEYNRDDVAVLKGAYFCGPVFKDAAKIEDVDDLVMDMTEQHSIFIPDYYQAVLSWKGVEYNRDRVSLKEAWIKGKYVNSIETLEDTDWILIDCRQHDAKKHPFHLVYFSEVCKENKEKKF